LQNKSKWKTQRDKFPKFDWERARSWHFCTHTQLGKQNKECGGGRVDAISPRPIITPQHRARLANTYLFVCEWRAEANLSSHEPREKALCCAAVSLWHTQADKNNAIVVITTSRNSVARRLRVSYLLI
jgi:hypothetical protein